MLLLCCSDCIINYLIFFAENTELARPTDTLNFSPTLADQQLNWLKVKNTNN